EPKLTGPEQRQWYERLVVENDNLREALAYACESRDGERALMLAGTIWRFWWNRGRLAEAWLCYERGSAGGQNASPTARARAAVVRSNLGYMLMSVDDRRAGPLIERALEGYRCVGDTYGIASCLGNLAVIDLHGGETEAAAAKLRESLGLSNSIGDAHTLTWS